jgi:hypothetical protein
MINPAPVSRSSGTGDHIYEVHHGWGELTASIRYGKPTMAEDSQGFSEPDIEIPVALCQPRRVVAPGQFVAHCLDL